MNTPAHLAASVLCWRGEKGWGPAVAVTVGALLPDLPMFGFYAYQKLWAGRTERAIWSTLYFQDDWQLLFDMFNSIPLAIVLMLIARAGGFRWGMLCAASALLHMACDLPLHNDDAHRHFLPLTDWRFASPLSYWDPQYHGHYFMWMELVFAIAACLFVGFRGGHLPIRFVAFATLALYFTGLAFAVIVWMG